MESPQTEMDLRPTLDVDNLSSSHALRTYRRRAIARRLTKRTLSERRRLYYVMRKYRSKQTQLLGKESGLEDPDPYEPTYIFYCFTDDNPKKDNGDSVLRSLSDSESQTDSDSSEDSNDSSN